MRKEEFLRQLEYLLQDISEEDRVEAINYYADYLEEAGPENEEAVLTEFGSPERIASIIRSDHAGNLEDGGSFTEKGFEDERFREPNYQVAERLELPEEPERTRKKEEEKHRGFSWGQSSNTKRTDTEYKDTNPNDKNTPHMQDWLKVVIGVIILIAALPFLLGTGGTLLGLLTAAPILLITFLLVAAILVIAFLVVGVIALFGGFAALFAEPVEGVFVIGVGLLLIGLGLLMLIFSIWFYGTLVPRIFRWIIKGVDAVSDRVRRL